MYIVSLCPDTIAVFLSTEYLDYLVPTVKKLVLIPNVPQISWAISYVYKTAISPNRRVGGPKMSPRDYVLRQYQPVLVDL
jgi:hypothetical protein